MQSHISIVSKNGTFVTQDDFIKKVSYEKKSHWFIIRSSNPWRIRWDLIIILLALYNSISVPLSVAFKVEETYVLFQIWEYVVDFLFFVDIIVNFLCSYIDREGEEICEPKLIAR